MCARPRKRDFLRSKITDIFISLSTNSTLIIIASCGIAVHVRNLARGWEGGGGEEEEGGGRVKSQPVSCQLSLTTPDPSSRPQLYGWKKNEEKREEKKRGAFRAFRPGSTAHTAGV